MGHTCHLSINGMVLGDNVGSSRFNALRRSGGSDPNKLVSGQSGVLVAPTRHLADMRHSTDSRLFFFDPYLLDASVVCAN